MNLAKTKFDQKSCLVILEFSKSDMDLEEETPVVEAKPFVETSTKSGNQKLKLINNKSLSYLPKYSYFQYDVSQHFYNILFVISFRSCGKRRATSEGM